MKNKSENQRITKTVVRSNSKKSKPIDTLKISFNRVLKSNDYNLKYKKANYYFENKKYDKALDLYKQLVPYERGREKGEEVAYKEALCNYYLGDRIYAGYLFKNFYDTYPNSKYAKEALFMSAMAYFQERPRWSLDQKITAEALERFQFYLTKYPDAEKKDTINQLVSILQNQLDKKAYMNSRLYYDLEYYKAAEIALNIYIDEFPVSNYREQAYYDLCLTTYEYAKKSILEKQKERLQNSLNYCIQYQQEYPNGQYLKEIAKIEKEIRKKLQNI